MKSLHSIFLLALMWIHIPISFSQQIVKTIFDGKTFVSVLYPKVIETFITGVGTNGTPVVGYYNNPPDLEGFTFNGSRFENFQFQGATFTEFEHVNNRGDVVGIAGIQGGAEEGLFFSNGKFSVLQFPGATNTVATGINDNRFIVGDHGATVPAACFCYHNGKFVTFSVPHALTTTCTGINNAGVIVGFYDDDNFIRHGFMTSPISGADFQ